MLVRKNRKKTLQCLMTIFIPDVVWLVKNRKILSTLEYFPSISYVIRKPIPRLIFYVGMSNGYFLEIFKRISNRKMFIFFVANYISFIALNIYPLGDNELQDTRENKLHLFWTKICFAMLGYANTVHGNYPKMTISLFFLMFLGFHPRFYGIFGISERILISLFASSLPNV